MKTITKTLVAYGIVALMLLTVALAASADGATEIYVNGQLLDESNPYWKNGNTEATQDDWNVYFDAATSTVTLKDAQVDTPHSYQEGERALLSAQGDLTVVMVGSSNLQYSHDSYDEASGIYASGDLTIQGSGEIDIQISSTAEYTLDAEGNEQQLPMVYAVHSDRELYIEEGTFNFDVKSGHTAYGFQAAEGILFSGGMAMITTEAENARAVYADNGDFRMAGGSVRAKEVPVE